MCVCVCVCVYVYCSYSMSVFFFPVISKISETVIFKALNAQSVRVGDKVTFQAKLSETNRVLSFLAVEMCYASLDESKGSMEIITFIENG